MSEVESETLPEKPKEDKTAEELASDEGKTSKAGEGTVTNELDEESSDDIGLIIGIIGASLAILIVIVLITVLICKRKSSKTDVVEYLTS